MWPAHKKRPGWRDCQAGPLPQKTGLCRFGLMSPYPGDVALRFTVRPCQVASHHAPAVKCSLHATSVSESSILRKKPKNSLRVFAGHRQGGRMTKIEPIGSWHLASALRQNDGSNVDLWTRQASRSAAILQDFQSGVHSVGRGCSIPSVMARNTSSSSSKSRLSPCQRISRVMSLWCSANVLAVTTRSRQEKNIS